MCPPGTDQTTRTAQTWHIMVPTVREKCKSWFPSGRQRSRGCIPNEPWVWDKLARPDPESLRQSRPQTVSLPLTCRPQSSLLFALPREIRDEVYRHLDRFSICCLGLTCLDMLHEIQPMIEARTWKESGTWVGQPLACLGTWLTSLPPQFEVDNLAGSSVGISKAVREYSGRRWRPFARDFNWGAVSDFKGPSSYNTYDREGQVVDDTERNRTERQHWFAALDHVETEMMKAGELTKSGDRAGQGALDLLRDAIQGSLHVSYSGDHAKRPWWKRARQGVKRAHSDDSSVDKQAVYYLRNLDAKKYIRIVRQGIPPTIRESLGEDSRNISPSSSSQGSPSSSIESSATSLTSASASGSSPTSSSSPQSDRASPQLTYLEQARQAPWVLIEDVDGNDDNIRTRKIRKQKKGPSIPVFHSVTNETVNRTDVTVEHVMAFKTWWPDETDRPNESAQRLKKLREQTWAGHRFDVVSVRLHEYELQGGPNINTNTTATDPQMELELDGETPDLKTNSGGGWQDVTRECMEEVLKAANSKHKYY